MKRLMIIFLFLISGFLVKAQESAPDPIKKNEISLDVYSLLTRSVNVQYERYFPDDYSIGLRVGSGYSNEFWDFQSIFFVSPTFRQYFAPKHRTKGFFLEASTRLAYDEYTVKTGEAYNFEYHEKKGLLLGLGLGLGLKFANDNGMTGTMKMGAGRRFLKEKISGSYFYPDVEVSFGKRF